MDYGHTKNSTNEPTFFTPGIGNIPANQNTPERNLNSSENSWSFETNPHDTRSLGNRAIYSGETQYVGAPSETPQAMGEIISLAPIPQETSHLAINEALIHPQGDRISDDTVGAVKQILRDFGAPSKPLDSTYNELIAMREAYQAKLIGKRPK